MVTPVAVRRARGTLRAPLYRIPYRTVVTTMRWAVLMGLVLGVAGCGSADLQRASDPAGGLASATRAASTSEPGRTPPSPPASLAGLLPASLNGVELHTFPVGGDIINRLASTLGIGAGAIEAAYASEQALASSRSTRCA